MALELEPACLQRPQSRDMVKYVLTGATGELGSRVFKNLIKLVPGMSSSNMVRDRSNSTNSKRRHRFSIQSRRRDRRYQDVGRRGTAWRLHEARHARGRVCRG